MKVYSVVGSVAYEGDDLLGVFGSHEDAVQFIRDQGPHKYYQYGIVMSDLGEEIDVDGMAEWFQWTEML